jgi:GH35 family endo-1,4-beta-xylanase
MMSAAHHQETLAWAFGDNLADLPLAAIGLLNPLIAGAARRPLPFDENLQPKPAYDALVQAFANAPSRPPLW